MITLFKIVISIILTLYGILTVYAYIKDDKLEKNKIKTILYLLIGIGMIVSIIGLVTNEIMFIIFLIISLLGLHMISIYNGYQLYHKPNWKHHSIRFIISIVLILSYISLL